MAEDLTLPRPERQDGADPQPEPEPEPEPGATAEPKPLVVRLPTRRERARKTAYRLRFALVYVFLAAVVGAAVGTFIVLMTRPDAAPQARWSAWEPTGSDAAKAKQIADRVSNGYRLPSGSQLAVAIVRPPQVTTEESGTIRVDAIAVRPDTSRGQAEEDDVDLLEADGALMYVLCGLGERCSIPEGEPSEARHELLRREALELSLYTFKYLRDVHSVVVFLPPRPDDTGVSTAVFLQRKDVTAELEAPLARTLAPKPPQLGAIDPLELGTINRLTRPRVYEYGFTQAQNGAYVLVLNSIPLTP